MKIKEQLRDSCYDSVERINKRIEIYMNKPIKNAIIINGRVYAAKRKRYNFIMPNVCSSCDLCLKCESNSSVFCAPFEKKGFLPYFKKIK